MGCILKGNSGLWSRMTVGAVLLAAGAGSRLGGRPKALLELGGVPLILRQLIALSGAGVDEVVVVLGHHAEAIEAAVRPFPITLVHNPRPDDGRPSSVRTGLQALSPRLDAVMVVLADQPLIDAQDISALIGAFKKRGAVAGVGVGMAVASTAGAAVASTADAAVASLAGAAAMVVPRVRTSDGSVRPGNPVIFDAALREAWLTGDADLACRRWREANPDRVSWFDTDNQRYGIDIDTPEDIEQFQRSTGHRLLWPESPSLPAGPALAPTPAMTGST